MVFTPSLTVVFLAPRRPPDDFLGRDQSPSGLTLLRPESADVWPCGGSASHTLALSEKSLHLGDARVRLSLW